MKKLYYFISLAAMFLFAGCSSDVDELVLEKKSVNINNGVMTVGVAMPGSDGTRVSTEDLKNLVWKTGDKIIAKGFNSNSYYATQVGTTELTLISGGNTSNGVFSGKAIEGATFYEYHYYGAAANADKTFDFTKQVQKGASSAHIGDFLHLGTLKIDANTTEKIILKPKNVVFKINVKSLPKDFDGATNYEFLCTVTSPYQNGDAKMKLVYEGSLDQENNYLYMILPEGTTLEDNRQYIKFVINANGKQAKAKVKATNTIYYVAGKIYTLTLDLLNPGSWIWETPSIPIFTPKFDSTDGWTEETTPNTLSMMKFSPFVENYGNGPSHDAITFEADDANTNNGYVGTIKTRYISDIISLKENNEIMFNYYVYGFADGVKATDRFKFEIREVGGAWKEIAIPKLGLGFMSESGPIAIPSDYNNKNIQISFFIHSEPYKTIWGTDFNGSTMQIFDLKLVHR